jgi:uncharacterized membrane protein YozB (DUF420 family)
MADILLITTTSLIIEYVILSLLIISFGLKRQGKYRQHGMLLLAAVILHTITIFAVMVPSILSITGTSSFSVGLKTLIILHAGLGALTWVLGVFIIASWRLRAGIAYCQPKKHWMLATYIIWIIEIILGTIVYLSLYIHIFG